MKVVPYRSRAIIPYRLGRAVLASRKARLGLSVARFAYNNRKALFRVGRAVMKRKGIFRQSRARKRYKSRVTSDRAAGPSNQSWYDVGGIPAAGGLSTSIDWNRKQLWSAVVQLAKAPSNTELLGQPARNQIVMKGLKVCFNAENFSNGQGDSTIVHFALVQAKGQDTTVQPFSTLSFFSRPGGGADGLDRSKNFIDFAVSPTPDRDYNCLGINTSKWNVITHTKRWLVPKATNIASGKSMWKYEKYFNLKGKRFMWDATGADFTNKPIVALVWHEKPVANGDAALNISFNINTVTYFKNSL